MLVHMLPLLAVVTFCLATLPALAQVAAPTITPSTGSFYTQQDVTMSDTSCSNCIFFTTDGTVPTNTSTPYTAALTITSPTQINAVAYSGTYSPVTTVYLDVDPSLAPILQSTFNMPSPPPVAFRVRSGFGLITGVGSPAPISQWIDLSGSGYSATASPGNQPTVSYFEGQPIAHFDGSSQYFSFPSGLFSQSYNGATIFMVTKANSLTAGARLFDSGQGSSGNNICFQISSSGSYGSYSTYNGTSGTSVTSSPNSLIQGSYQLLDAVQTPASPYTGSLYLNGIFASSAGMNAPPTVTRSSNYIGQASAGGSLYAGDIAEVLVFYGSSTSNQLTTSRRTAVEAMFLQKYQLLSLNPEMPVISQPTSTLIEPAQIAISSQPGAITYITKDGSTPTSSSQAYFGGPIPINYTQTIKAVAIKNGVSSAVASATYTLDSTMFPAPSSGDHTAPTINLQLPVQSQ